MKKILALISILVLTLLLNCVAFNKALAAEDTWYSQAAERAGNQVLLEDEEYYQGISLKSHIISDLTFMEIPFQDYVDGNKDKVQIITFAEAMYRRSDEIVSEVVMYVYFPSGVSLEFPKIWVDLEFTSQVSIVGDLKVDVLKEEDKGHTYNTIWGDISQYGHIVKYSGGTYQKAYYQKKVNKWLLNEYNGNSELQTVFNARITEYEYYNTMYGSHVVKNDSSSLYYRNQNFQFITAKNNVLEATGYSTRNVSNNIYERITLCVGSDKDYVKVDGTLKKYRYLTEDIDGDFNFVNYKLDATYTDIYYLFFNVFNGDTQLDGNIVLTQITVDYIIGNLSLSEHYRLMGEYTHKVDYSINFVDETGKVIETVNDTDIEEYKTPEKYYEEFEILMSDRLDNKNLYHRQVITPKEMKINYLENSSHNVWVAFTDGDYHTRDATYLTLFNTSSDGFKKIVDYSDSETSSLINNYDFGAVVGNPNGYAYSNTSSKTILGEEKVQLYETFLNVVGLVDIEFDSDGNHYRIVVNENVIDNSGAFEPAPDDKDPVIDIPAPDVPKDDTPDSLLEILLWLIEFFTVTLPEWIDNNKEVVIGVIVVIVAIIVTIFLVKLFRNWRTERMLNKIAHNQVQNNNQPQQKPKRKTSKKKE